MGKRKLLAIISGISLAAMILTGCNQNTGLTSAINTVSSPVSVETASATSLTQTSIPTQTTTPSKSPVLTGHSSTTNTLSTVTVSSLQASMVQIPGGQFAMGDHFGVVDPQHPTDEVPIHNVTISPYYMDKFDITVQQYCDFLNSAMAQGQITIGGGAYYVSGAPRDSISVNGGLVYLKGGKDYFFLTLQAYNHSTISWDGQKFSVLDNRQNHPATSVSWFGAAAYCNWLSIKDGYQPCYNTTTWDCDFTKNGYRLPTEAEWEYAARGGQNNPYYNYPWGNDADKTKANWPNSGDPYEAGAFPLTTPVGFYNGQLQHKADYNWLGSQDTYQTANGANAYGLYDMAGNVWQWCNDWYQTDYYKVSPAKDPPGPAMAQASPMPDGKINRCMRGGNWYNGEPDKLNPSIDNGHSRVSNRDPAYYLGEEEFQNSEVGFRIVRR